MTLLPFSWNVLFQEKGRGDEAFLNGFRARDDANHKFRQNQVYSFYAAELRRAASARIR